MIWLLMFAIGFAILAAGLWMFSDAYDRLGLFAAVAWGIGFVFFPPIVIVYFLLLHLAGFSGWLHTRASREDEAWFKKHAPALRTHREDDVKPLTREELMEVAKLKLPEKMEEHELDERIEELLQAGRLRDATTYARDMLEMARELKDATQVKRYEKYVFLLELGPLGGRSK